MKLRFTALLSVAALLCSGINASLTESDKDVLLARHKSVRSAVGASDMKSISWSSSLAAKAQSYADGCHGMNHSGAGPENLASRGNRDVGALFDQWKDEKSDFLASGYASNFKDVYYKGRAIGHYSQIVWASNTEVGCGLAECSGSYYLVCRYGEGNKVGEKVYSGGSSSHKEEKSEDKHEEKHEEKKTTTTTRKTTTTTTTTIKKTTTVATTTVAVTTIKAVTTTGLPLGTATKLVGTTTGLATPTSAAAAAAVKVNAKKTKADASNEGKTGNDKIEIKNIEIDENEEGSNPGNVAAGVAVTGSVVGAAAAFVFLKKNPNQYDQLKRSLSRKASSVKRGASVVTRRLTTKKTTPPTTTATAPTSYNANDYNFTYRADFVDSMQV
eukprot:jgi/Orpsp1_1/1182287/evm.model.c7180000080658.1